MNMKNNGAIIIKANPFFKKDRKKSQFSLPKENKTQELLTENKRLIGALTNR